MVNGEYPCPLCAKLIFPSVYKARKHWSLDHKEDDFLKANLPIERYIKREIRAAFLQK